jgi:hypothetical protein
VILRVEIAIPMEIEDTTTGGLKISKGWPVTPTVVGTDSSRVPCAIIIGTGHVLSNVEKSP